MRERVARDKVPYDKWAENKWVNVTPGNVVDYTMVEEKILELAKLYHVVEVDSDRAFAAMLLQRLEQAKLTCVDIPQTFKTLTDPLTLSGVGTAAGAAGAAAADPLPSPIRASGAPTAMTSSSLAKISSRTPATGDGTSVSTLSVEISTMGSSTATGSPTFFSQRVTVPSVTLSPRAGRLMFVLMGVLFLLGFDYIA